MTLLEKTIQEASAEFELSSGYGQILNQARSKPLPSSLDQMP